MKKKIDSKPYKFENASVFFDEKITVYKPKPNNLLTKILWRFLKVKIIAQEIPNPIYVQMHEEQDLFSLLPKASWTKPKWNVRK